MTEANSAQLFWTESLAHSEGIGIESSQEHFIMLPIVFDLNFDTLKKKVYLVAYDLNYKKNANMARHIRGLLVWKSTTLCRSRDRTPRGSKLLSLTRILNINLNLTRGINIKKNTIMIRISGVMVGQA